MPSSDIKVNVIFENVNGSLVSPAISILNLEMTLAIAAVLCINPNRIPGHLRGPSPKARKEYLYC